jgi:hypothetical protein
MTITRIYALSATGLIFAILTGGTPSWAQVVHPANAEQVDYAALDEFPDWRGIWLPTSGGRPVAEQPALIAEYQERRNASVEGGAINASAGVPARASNCLPPGMPSIMTQPYSLEFLFTPGKVTIIQEAYMQVRRVFTDGRPLPENPEPSFNGYSIGHWDDDTLIIETVGIKDTVPLTRARAWHGPDLKITEHIFLDDADTDVLHLQFTFEDPDALEKPWHRSATFRRSREWEQLEFVCAENDRNPIGADGETEFLIAE